MHHDGDQLLRRDVAQALRELREDKGVTQSHLATMLGVQQSLVSKYESGERKLDIVDVRAICRAVGADFPAFAQSLETRWEEIGES